MCCCPPFCSGWVQYSSMTKYRSSALFEKQLYCGYKHFLFYIWDDAVNLADVGNLKHCMEGMKPQEVTVKNQKSSFDPRVYDEICYVR